MKKKEYYLCVVLLMGLAVSCIKQKSQEIQLIDLDKVATNSLSARSLLKSLKYINLSTPDTLAISRITELKICNNSIFIYDANLREILRFDSVGTYKNNFVINGIQPNEKIIFGSFAVSESEVFVFINSIQKTFVFNYEGIMLNSYDNLFYASRMEYCYQSLYYYFPMPIINENKNRQIARLDLITGKTYQVGGPTERIKGNKAERHSFIKTGTILKYWNAINDEILIIRPNNSILTEMELIYSNKPSANDFLSSNWDIKSANFSLITRLIYTNDALFIDFVRDKIREPIIYFTSLFKFAEVDKIFGHDYFFFGIKNDIDNGLPIWPDFSTDGKLVQIVEIIELKKLIYDEERKHNSAANMNLVKLKSICEHCSNISNPLLIICQ